MKMNLNFDLNLIQEQKMVMTQQMQLSVKLLQMSSYELEQYIDSELQENPVLEVKEDKIDYKELIKYLEYDDHEKQYYDYNNEEEVSPFNFIASTKTLSEDLKEQLSYLNVTKSILSVCYYIIENLDEKGYLSISTEDIADALKTPLETVNKALEIVQSLDPVGIGARSLNECLKIQLKKLNITDEKIYSIVENYLEDVGANRFGRIAEELNIDVKVAQKYGDMIKRLEPKPARGYFTGETTGYIIPDAFIKKIDGEYHILLNQEVTPKLKINTMYKDIIKNENDSEALDYVKNKINSAMFLIKSVEHRKSTIYSVLETILKLQQDYFDFGKEYLRPMNLKEIATEIGMHESTVSRAVREKYIATERGVVKLKDLFTTGISSSTNYENVSVLKIKDMIKSIVAEENKSKPASDQNICDELNRHGMNISRRTVAKYREEIGIKASSKRKRY